MHGSTGLLRDQTFTEEDFSHRNLDHFVAVGCTFIRCDFSGVRSKEFVFGGGGQASTYRECVFDGAKLKGTGADVAVLDSCSFRQVKLTDWECQGVDLVDCTFTGVLQRCSFAGIVPALMQPIFGRTSNRIVGNDFSGCEFKQVALKAGVDMAAQRLPRGREYFWLPDLPAAVALLEEDPQGWQPAHPVSMRGLIAFFKDTIRLGRSAYFGRVSEFAKLGGELLPDVLDLLRSRGLEINPDV
ncbi:pentapeptide repeat-containing protein [Catellatospora citrea]|uniref:Pentapeptide repeat protein n=1 Tax=Catellatospora citrea TaxID=53366 RepID=A0A8J3KJ08_9ACTN|nr:pentapeptide repeat-containing protein [Catellatospora citrea]RKE05511.1 pentapeptide repeat protein [Catellatospora citrea]GIF96859.1 hypothetical protein Cci01nite_19530 [Catellatospora citrea]